MEIELRQHENGTYVLEVVTFNSRKEIDITHVLQDVFLDKLRMLQERIRLEEKYRDWVVESAQNVNTKLTTAYSRYKSIQERLTQTNDELKKMITSWRTKKDLVPHISKLARIVAQNDHFAKNDATLKELEKHK